MRTGCLATRCAVRYWPRLHNARQSRSTPCPTRRSAPPCACTATRQQSPRSQWLRRCSCARRVRTKRTARAAMTHVPLQVQRRTTMPSTVPDTTLYQRLCPESRRPSTLRACRWANGATDSHSRIRLRGPALWPVSPCARAAWASAGATLALCATGLGSSCEFPCRRVECARRMALPCEACPRPRVRVTPHSVCFV